MSESTLADALLTSNERPRIVAEVSQILETQVSSKRGLSGMALKTGLKMAKSRNPDAIPNAVDRLIPEFCEILEPYYADYKASDTAHFSTYVEERKTVIRDDILGIVDGRAAKSQNKTFVSTYAKLRGAAKDEVETALPKIAAVIENHLA